MAPTTAYSWEDVSTYSGKRVPHAVISAVNYCETIQCLQRGGMPLEEVLRAARNEQDRIEAAKYQCG